MLTGMGASIYLIQKIAFEAKVLIKRGAL